jgi:hypothetical protein
MNSFEDVRSFLATHHALKDNDPYVISFEMALGNGRRQSVFLAELDTDAGRKYLRVSTPVAPIGTHDAAKCLRFNWEQRVGYLALSDIDGAAYLHLCENRPFEGLGESELESMITELATLADGLESAMSRGRDVG